ALPFGLRATAWGIASSVILGCFLSLGISAASYAVGLILKDEDSFAPFVQRVSLPLLLLSGILLPMTLAPTWLRRLSEITPLTYVVDANRALFRGDIGDSDVWIGVAIAIALTVLLAWWG